MASIKFEFDIGDLVKIGDVDLKGRIVGLYYGDTGCQYQVSYFYEGNNKREYLYGFDLQLLSKTNKSKFGFIKD